MRYISFETRIKDKFYRKYFSRILQPLICLSICRLSWQKLYLSNFLSLYLRFYCRGASSHRGAFAQEMRDPSEFRKFALFSHHNLCIHCYYHHIITSSHHHHHHIHHASIHSVSLVITVTYQIAAFRSFYLQFSIRFQNVAFGCRFCFCTTNSTFMISIHI